MTAPRKRKGDDPGQYLPLLAVAAADRVKPRSEPLSRSEALAAAPWSADMPAAWETAFRKAYADQLEERELALPAKRSGSPGRPGKNLHGRRTFRASPEEFEQHDAMAEADGVPWNTWARRKLLAK